MTNGELPELPPGVVEAAVRRYLARIARRYSPFVVGLTALLLVVTLVPTVSNNQNGSGSGRFAAGANGAGEAGTGDTGTATTLPGQAANGASTVGGPGATSGGRRGAAAAITPPAKAGSAGVTRSGVNCGPNVRQVAWSKYAPICMGISQPSDLRTDGSSSMRMTTGRSSVMRLTPPRWAE